MKTFIQHINEAEAIATPREGIEHLAKMKDPDFIDWVKTIASELYADVGDMKVSLKFDGGAGRFGKDSMGRVFFEGARTGPIYNPGSFTNYATSKGGSEEILVRAGHYDEMFKLITKSDFIEKLPNDCKVVCELLYNPMAHVTDTGLKFVKVSYDQAKLGKILTIIPIDVLYASTGTHHINSHQILQQLLTESTDDVKFVDPSIDLTGSMEIHGVIEPVSSLNDDSKRILASRKRVDQPMKDSLKEIIYRVKESLTQMIMNHPDIIKKDKLGDQMEGVVIEFAGKKVKITTEEYRSLK